MLLVEIANDKSTYEICFIKHRTTDNTSPLIKDFLPLLLLRRRRRRLCFFLSISLVSPSFHNLFDSERTHTPSQLIEREKERNGQGKRTADNTPTDRLYSILCEREKSRGISC